MELFLGVVPTFRSGPCDKTLEGFEGQPLPSHLRLKTLRENSKVKDYWPPTQRMEIDSKNKIRIIDLRPINAKAYAEEIGEVQMERGPNEGILYF